MFIFDNCLLVGLLYCGYCLLCYLRFVCVIISGASELVTLIARVCEVVVVAVTLLDLVV